MISRVVVFAFLLFPLQGSAENEIGPLHFINANWSLSARDNPPVTPFAALNYGFQQADLASDPQTTGQLLATNNCVVSTAVRSFQDMLQPTNISVAGCEPTTTLPLEYAGGFAFILPGGEVDPFFFQDRVVPVDSVALGSEAYAFSTSMGTSAVDGPSVGFAGKGFFQSFVAEKSVNAQIGDLVGDWAITRLEVEVGVSQGEVLYTVLTFPAAISADGGGNLNFTTETAFIESEFVQFLDGSPVEKRRFESTTEDEGGSLPLNLSPDGELSFETGDTGQPGRNPQVLSGFIAPTADFFVLAEGVPGISPLRLGDSNLPDVSQFSAHQLFVGIKRNSDPNLNGRKYQLVGLKFHPNTDRFELVNWTNRSEIHFQDSSMGSWTMDIEGRHVALGNVGATGITSFAESAVVPFGYSVGDDGRIFIDLSAIENLEQGLVNGYASVDNRILVFSHALSLNGATKGEIGMWIGLCTNCDPPINAGHAGAWFNTATAGQGQFIDVEPESQFMFVSWFTHTDAASDNPNEQQWYTAQGNYSGNTANLDLFETLGGKFDDPQEVTATQVGEVTLSFSDCGQGQMSYRFDEDGRQGQFPMQRVIPGSDNVCEERNGNTTQAVDINAGMDGAWFDPDTSGQGFFIDAHPDPEGGNFIFVSWFTYGEATASGQRWLTAQGSFEGSTAEIDVFETTGGSFDDPQAPSTTMVGTMSIDFTDCSNAQLTYALTDNGAEGDIAITRVIPGGQALCEELSGAE